MKTTINPEQTKTAIVVVEKRTISITLTEEEAGCLASILGKICYTNRNSSEFDSCGLFKKLIDFVGDTNYDDIYSEKYVGRLEVKELT